MIEHEKYRKPPTAFISYTHDNDAHKRWVQKFYSDLRFQGIDVTLDEFNLKLGEDLFYFMEKGISENEFIIVICTPAYKTKADNRQGGGGYETRLATAILAGDLLTDKIIPILVHGDQKSAIPTYLKAALYADFRDKSRYDMSLEALVSTLFREERRPSVGWPKHALASIFGNTNPAYDPPPVGRRMVRQVRTAPILLDETIDGLRTKSKVVRIGDMDNERPVLEFDEAVFGFTVPWILDTSDRGIVGGTGPDKICLNTEPGGTVQLEIHRRSDGTIAFVGYCNKVDFISINKSETISKQKFTFTVSPHKEYLFPLSVPVGLIDTYRHRSLPDHIYAVDIKLA